MITIENTSKESFIKALKEMQQHPGWILFCEYIEKNERNPLKISLCFSEYETIEERNRDMDRLVFLEEFTGGKLIEEIIEVLTPAESGNSAGENDVYPRDVKEAAKAENGL